MHKAALVFSLCASIASCAPTHATGPTACVKNGTYQGVYSPEYNLDYFLGIPYAQPPVGHLRFRKPIGVNESWSGARPATQYSSAVSLPPNSTMTLWTDVLTPNSAMAMDLINGAIRFQKTASMPMSFDPPEARTRSFLSLSGSMGVATIWEVE